MAKEGSSDNKKVRKRWFFKETLTEWFFVEPKMVLLWHRCEELFKHLYFLKCTPDLYHKEILYLYGFVISVSHISLCVTVDRTLVIEFN